MSENTQANISAETKIYLNLVESDPHSWVLRKEAALKLYSDGEYTMAADMVWNASEIPSTDMDVAFAVKMLSRAKPNRSIRLVYELLRQNSGKAEQAVAMANVFNLIGYPMLASRCYGAAVSLNANFFDIGFEHDSFWCDESRVLEKQLDDSGFGRNMHFALQGQELQGEAIQFDELDQELDRDSFKAASEAAALGDVTGLVPAFEKLQVVMQPSIKKHERKDIAPMKPEAKTPSGGDHAALYADRVGVAPPLTQPLGTSSSDEEVPPQPPQLKVNTAAPVIPSVPTQVPPSLTQAPSVSAQVPAQVPSVAAQTPSVPKPVLPNTKPTKEQQAITLKLKNAPVPVLRVNKNTPPSDA